MRRVCKHSRLATTWHLQSRAGGRQQTSNGGGGVFNSQHSWNDKAVHLAMVEEWGGVWTKLPGGF